jgi:putative Holliday junction resolvase
MPRVLGLDYGEKRVGAAISDPGKTLATPLGTFERGDPKRDAELYARLVREHEVERIVVGLPLHTSGKEGPSAAAARKWGAWLAKVTGLPLVYHDERFTSVEAEEILRSARVRSARRQGKRDMIAASVLLQAYLDAGAPLEDSPPVRLDDEDGSA